MRSKKDELRQDLSLEVDRGHAHLTDLEAAMKAIYRGEVDGIAVDGPDGRRVFTLQNPEEPYRILAERMSEGIATLTCEGTILFCNRRMAEMAGLPAEQLLGSCFTARLSEEVRQGFSESIRQALESDVRMEGYLLAANRSKLPVQLSLSSISLKECGQGICLVATDLSNQKRAEEEVRLRRERELRLKDQLLSHVSHELRSPLTSVHQFTTILLDGLSGPLNSEQRSDLEIVLKSANQLRVMIDDLLETARIEAGKIKIERGCVVLQDLVREAVEMLRATAAENRVALRHDGQTEPLLVYADPHRVLEILLNLVGNALKFTSARGWVELKYGVARDDAAYALVSVKDNGCGISESAQAHIFERLYQEEGALDQGRRGLGLGLAICRELVSRHTGKIWVESQAGQGSTFSFTLPLYSLERILAPVLVDDGRPRKTVSLITVRAAPKPTSAAIEQWNGIRRKCLEVLQSCTLPDKDVLLPPAGRLANSETFAILAGTDERGAEVLVRRIRDQMKRCPEIAGYGSAQISAAELKTKGDGNQSEGANLAEITDEVTRAVSRAISKGGECDE